MTDRDISSRSSTTGRDLKFAGTIAAALCAGVLGVGAIAVPLVGWNDWPQALSVSSGDPIKISTVTEPGGPRSGAGKSGGQRQKLTTTCLAAALRYQLAGSDRALPVFSTVVIDEAFDKADAEFTTMSMNIFRNLGFQMLVATPMKGVMAVEPFIGGACFVHIKDRRKSQAVQVQYDSSARRLLLDQDLLDAQEAPVA